MNLRPRPHPGMAKISLIGIATILMLAGVAAGANSSHSALEDPFEGPRVDPSSIMVNAKNLPSQQSFNFEDVASQQPEQDGWETHALSWPGRKKGS